MSLSAVPLKAALLLGGLGLLGVLALLGFAVATQLNNSGRGLDTDEWEVDHSVWMDQLEKDFENSWSENWTTFKLWSQLR